MSLDNIIVFTVAQGSEYEKMASGLFKSLKFFHPELKTACIAHNKPEYSDYFFNIQNLCPIRNCVNEAHLNHQAYSFKLGIYQKLPEDFLRQFEKVLFYDCDSLCIQPISYDKSIYDQIFYVPWCQSIVTQNEKINQKINLDWAWHGSLFSSYRAFAEINNIKEWRNVNAGMITFSTKHLEFLTNLYIEWTKKIYKFYGENHSTEELTFSLMMTDIDPEYQTPNICNNKLGQLCMNKPFNEVLNDKKFNYAPWFNSTEKSGFIVEPTCVHFPNQKSQLIKN